MQQDWKQQQQQQQQQHKHKQTKKQRKKKQIREDDDDDIMTKLTQELSLECGEIDCDLIDDKEIVILPTQVGTSQNETEIELE